MKNRKLLPILLLTLCLLLAGCQKKEALTGRFRAVNPPVESGEMVTETLSFADGKVTMSSGDTSQTVAYDLKDGKFTIHTSFGDFSYSCEKQEDGSLVIDGVQYRPE